MLFAVLTVSDRCSQGQANDTAGPAVEALLREGWPAATIGTALLPDEEDQIATWLIQQSDRGVCLILTVGGTGLSPRDRTPEASLRVIDRNVPGLSEAMRLKGSEGNLFAWLSRGVAGLRGSSLIVNLPGSRRGAQESLAAILPLLRHALEVVAGSETHP
jgi:molybdenum cofactor synthesis domain-containing protein